MTSEDVGAEYASSLADLTLNSKPLINMLTILAEENIDHAPAIVGVIEKHLNQARPELKLPALYLVDSIVKNIGRSYLSLFTINIVSTFCSVFEKVEESTRASMFKLRQTWNDVFPPKKLYALDVRVKSIDPAWPITAPPPTSIHVNPAFISKQQAPAKVDVPEPVATSEVPGTGADITEIEMRESLLRKQKELVELQYKKLELELLQTKARLNQPLQLLTTTETKKPEEILASSPVPVIPDKPLKAAAVTPVAEIPAPQQQEVKPLPVPEEIVVPPKPPTIGSLAGLRRSESPEKKSSGTKRKDSRKDKDSKKDSDRDRKRSRKESDRSSKKESSPRSKKESDGSSSRKSRTDSATSASDEDVAAGHVKVEASHLRNHREAAKSMPRIPKLVERNASDSRDPRLQRNAEPKKIDEKREEVESKKRKAHVMEDLFGSEDVDLRHITAPAVQPPQAALVARVSPTPGSAPNWPHKKRQPYAPPPPQRGRGAWHRGRGRPGHPPAVARPEAPWSSPGDDSWEGPGAGDDGSGSPKNMDIILGQAEEQHRNGLIDDGEYQTVIRQVFHMNESKMIREVQRRESMELPPREQQDPRFFQGPPRDHPSSMEGPWHPPRGHRDPRRAGFAPHGFRPRFEPQPFRGPTPPGPPARVPGPPGPPMQASEFRPDNDMKTINIDNIPREIRFYGETAVILMADDDPRELTFQPIVRTVYIDNIPLECRVGDGFREFHYDGNVHRVKLGAPTRELIVDDQWYECIFGGPPVTVNIGGRMVPAALEGPPPTVSIGTERRPDLVAGRINMIIDALSVIPVYLDLKQQFFQMMGRTHSLQFKDCLRTVVIDGTPYRADFGGLPFAINLGGRKHFVRFSSLPRGVEAGQVLKPLLPTNIPPVAAPMQEVAAAATVAALPDVSNLLEKLIQSGLLPQAPAETKPPVKVEESVSEINFTPESLRKRQNAIITALYSGMQCGSCGLRFPADQTIRYSAHLDWHFRQNRREKGAAKRPKSRRWYYEINDWIQYEETENAEEKRQNWFDSQAAEKGRPEETSDSEEFYSVPAGLSPEDNRCAVCNEDLEQFYNEESEEWHLKDAVRIEGVTYHRLCYRDYQAAQEQNAESSSEEASMEPDHPESERSEEEAEMKVKEETGETAQQQEAQEEEKVSLNGIKTEVVDEEMAENQQEPEQSTSDNTEIKAEPKDEPTESAENIATENEHALEEREEESTELTKTDPEPEEELPVKLVSESLDSNAPVVISSIDGNVELNTNTAFSLPVAPMKINLNFSSKSAVNNTVVEPTPPLPEPAEPCPEEKPEEPKADKLSPPEEVPLDEKALASKPRFAGKKLTIVPLQSRGTELSGLCSIM